MNVLTSKFREVLFSVLPIAILVLVINFTLIPMETSLIIRFLTGAFFVVIGLTVFLLGVDIGITPLGDHTGVALAKTGSLLWILFGGAILGFFISIAEPGLMVLANQVGEVTNGSISGIKILVVVSVGLAIMLSMGFLRIFYSISLNKLLIGLYILIGLISLFVSDEFLAISFDASGSTTGILAVPFILSLSFGISKLEKDSKSSENDSFGLVAVASTGAIMSVMLLNLFTRTNKFNPALNVNLSNSQSILSIFSGSIKSSLKDSIMAILPLIMILLILQRISFKLNKRELKKLITGFVFAFIGLFLFMTGVNAGFMDVGAVIGYSLAKLENRFFIVIISFIMGVVTILAEPAVHVLTHQIEDVTSGYIKRKIVLFPLALGVGTAVALSVVRILSDNIKLWHYLLAGYIICIVLTFFIPKLFVGIAFDAGGVATGPVTATFIMAFIQGAASSVDGADLLSDGFGMISMVAMMPIITLEILGLIFAIKSGRGIQNGK